ncbi:MAG TPA: ScyD/ScyE family protein [Xanthomonadales bacterium]|nr:ScyD/ScyE family protein [Xanthomonadales bacterium]
MVSAQFVTGLQGASGSTVGPDGALYVTEGAIGQVTRVDPWTGDKSTFASQLPPSWIGIGGAVDVAFLDGVAYVLVTLVASDLEAIFGIPADDVVGIYRIDGPEDHTVIADIGEFNIQNPSNSIFLFPTGVQYAMEPYRGGFLVTDGHHNRVLWVQLDGSISEFNVFGNIAPTGLEVHGSTVYMTQAGPVPHNPEDGIVWSFEPKSLDPVEVASGARLLVDVEFGLGRSLYALSQGQWNGEFEGSPAIPNDGSLLEINADGTFSVIADGLNLPTSVEFIGNTAYVVGLAGEIFRIDDVSGPPFGKKKNP